MMQWMGNERNNDRRNLDHAFVVLDLIGVMLRASTSARSSACTALFAPFDPFWPENRSSQTSMTMPSRANSQSTGLAPGSRLS